MAAHKNIKITASFGVAAISKPDLEHMFKEADSALYDAKNSGKKGNHPRSTPSVK